MKEIKVGIELEGIYNKEILSQSMSTTGGYGFSRGSPINTFWKHTTDASLNSKGEFDSCTTAEIVQFPVIGRSRFMSSLKAFQELSLGNELKDFVSFNESCGCHIHFSIPENLYKNILVEQVEGMRNNFFKKLKDSGLRSDLVKGIIKHYDREYARKIKKEDQSSMFKGSLDRKCELNVSCEKDNKGVEWRAFNLLGTRTWAEFYSLMDIAYDCLEDFLMSVRKATVVEVVSVKTPIIPKPKSFVMTIPASLKRFRKCAI